MGKNKMKALGITFIVIGTFEFLSFLAFGIYDMAYSAFEGGSTNFPIIVLFSIIGLALIIGGIFILIFKKARDK
jgi:uncharacterized protein with PQ loop repeat